MRQKKQAASDNFDEAGESTLRPMPVATERPPLRQRLMEKILAVTPVRKLSNDEYAEALQGRLRAAENELEKVDYQIGDIEQRLDQLQQGRGTSV